MHFLGREEQAGVNLTFKTFPWMKTGRISVRVTYVAANLIAEVRAVGHAVTLPGAVDTVAIVTLEVIGTTSTTT